MGLIFTHSFIISPSFEHQSPSPFNHLHRSITYMSIPYLLQIENDGKQSKSSNTYRSFLLSFLEVLCDLEQHPIVTSGDPYHNRSISYVIYELQISNDRKAFSTKKLPYIIYDSKCMECNVTSLSCTQRVC